MLTDDELPPLPTPQMVMVRLTAMQHLAAERFDADQLHDYGCAVEQAAYAAAIKACNNERIDAESTGAKEDYAYNAAIQHCIDTIRSLIEEPRTK